ncbi:hypothetical protein HDF24_21320 [Mucilaginibacter sp. X4EP1]|uniref:hypothetical protein n=1 Tax=Mucilaginibacter sp. X4EP1 TaxID=2723092 RepID=UPI002167B3B3|nr:hypothetical protein [Mucilaginibacter sp. X4EP1]MCS3812478.1 hypothetical protein [Mucilaginibacter sp. X4EP1]
MPTDHNNNDSENNPQKPISNKAKNTPIINVSVNTGIDQVNYVNTQGKENNNHPDAVTINVTGQPNDYTYDIAANRIATTANRIYKRSFWVNIGLFTGTILLAIIGTCQYKSSRSAAIIAQQTLDSTNAFNTRLLKFQKEANSSSDKAEYKRSQLDSQNIEEIKRYNDALLAAQKDVLIETKKDAIKKDKRDSANLAETKKEFQTENSPFLEIINAAINTIEKNKPVTITFSFYNHSKLPAQVIISKSAIEWSTYENPIRDPNMRPGQSKTNFYIANGVSQGFTTQIDSLTSNVIKGYNDGWEYIFLRGSCEYVDPVTNKTFIFSFVVRFYTKPIVGIETIKSSVEEEKSDGVK